MSATGGLDDDERRQVREILDRPPAELAEWRRALGIGQPVKWPTQAEAERFLDELRRRKAVGR